MHYGFYDDLDDIRECLLEQNDISDPLELDFAFLENEQGTMGLSPYDFLHGSCDVFARYLHDTYGYRVESLYKHGYLIHSYCVATVNGKPVYIDIRGTTDDLKEFWREFKYEPEDFWFDENSEFLITDSLPDYTGSMHFYEAARWMDEYYKYWD